MSHPDGLVQTIEDGHKEAMYLLRSGLRKFSEPGVEASCIAEAVRRWMTGRLDTVNGGWGMFDVKEVYQALGVEPEGKG